MRRRIAALGCLLALAAGGCAPRPEEPEGGYCVYYSALSDRFAPLPLDCEPFEGSGGDPIPALVDALLSPPETQGLTSPFPEGVRLLSWEVEEGRLHLDLSEQYGGLSGVDLTVADACLTLTLCQVEGVESVYVTVEGREIPYRRVQSFVQQHMYAAHYTVRKLCAVFLIRSYSAFFLYRVIEFLNILRCKR